MSSWTSHHPLSTFQAKKSKKSKSKKAKKKSRKDSSSDDGSSDSEWEEAQKPPVPKVPVFDKEQQEWIEETRKKQSNSRLMEAEEDDEIGPLPHRVLLTHKEMGKALLPGEGMFSLSRFFSRSSTGLTTHPSQLTEI